MCRRALVQYNNVKMMYDWEDGSNGRHFSLPCCCVCAPSDDYVTGCLLTRRGSKMLGMHQVVDCMNCMFGYCVLIGCLATEGGRQ